MTLRQLFTIVMQLNDKHMLRQDFASLTTRHHATEGHATNGQNNTLQVEFYFWEEKIIRNASQEKAADRSEKYEQQESRENIRETTNYFP